jgi:hypothetical protein
MGEDQSEKARREAADKLKQDQEKAEREGRAEDARTRALQREVVEQSRENPK